MELAGSVCHGDGHDSQINRADHTAYYRRAESGHCRVDAVASSRVDVLRLNDIAIVNFQFPVRPRHCQPLLPPRQ